ncbi:MAG: NADP-dependent oxidoreductase [Mesorhizobium sp.]
MKALVADALSSLDDLRIAERTSPKVRAGEILVRVHFAGINPADWKTAEGYLNRLPSFQPEFPFVIGMEGAGIVEAVGKGVTGFSPGDAVVLKSDVSQSRWGTFAEYISIEPGLAARLPRGFPLDHAASLPIAGLTSLHGLLNHAGLTAGEMVFIHAGSGGVGSFAVQIAARAGARVLASCSPANADYLKARGALATFDYRDAQMVEAVKDHGPCDIVLDAICNGEHQLAQCLRRGGRYVTIPTLEDDAHAPDAGTLAAIGATHRPGGLIRDQTRSGLERLIALCGDGLLLPELQVVAADAFVEALHDCKAGARRGKTVVHLWNADASFSNSIGEGTRQ